MQYNVCSNYGYYNAPLGCNTGCQINPNNVCPPNSIYNTNISSPSYQTQTTEPVSCSHQQDCNGCVDAVKSICVIYTGLNLVSTGINTNDNLEDILVKLDAIKAIQDVKNANILVALNDINDRLNALESGSDHDPYTLI